METKLKKRKGFTLIELIVVIAILGILAAVIVPKMSGYQANANKKAILSNLKIVDSAVASYAADKNVDITTVTSTQIIGANLITAMPSGPTASVGYQITSGVAEAVVATGGIPGVAAGTYNATSTALQ